MISLICKIEESTLFKKERYRMSVRNDETYVIITMRKHNCVCAHFDWKVSCACFSVLQYKLRRILMPNYNLWIFYIACSPQFVGLEIQCIKPEIINSHIKLLIKNLIISDANKHLLSPLSRKPVKKLLWKITLQPGFESGSPSMRNKENYPGVWT